MGFPRLYYLTPYFKSQTNNDSHRTNGSGIIRASLGPSGVSMIREVLGCQCSLCIIPNATLVWKSGDQAAELTRPITTLSFRASHIVRHGGTAGPDIDRERICRHGPFSIYLSNASLPTHLIALRV